MRRNVLNITASDVKDAKLTATVTIPAADVDAAIKKAYKDTAKKYRFPGFRAGKAPRPVIDSALGAEATLAQATNDLIAANEPAVLNELDIVPTKNGDYKELDLAKDHEDYTYTVEFSLRPAAELSSFDAVEIEMPPAEVTESEINNQVEMLLNYRATFEDVEGRAVEADDYVTVDLKAVENADNFAAEGRMLIAGSDSNPAEFNEALIGANVDDVKTVTWTDEAEEGEEAETHTVEVTVKGIKVRNTPELTDELVKSDFGFDSIDAMRDAIKIEIEQDKASRLPAEKENRCVSALAERLHALFLELPNVQGVDLAPRSSEVQQGDFLDLQYAADSMDLCISQCAFFVSGDQQKAVSECWRVLKKGGLLVLSDLDQGNLVEVVKCTGFCILHQEDQTALWREYYLEAIWNDSFCCEEYKLLQKQYKGKKLSYTAVIGRKE